MLHEVTYSTLFIALYPVLLLNMRLQLCKIVLMLFLFAVEESDDHDKQKFAVGIKTSLTVSLLISNVNPA